MDKGMQGCKETLTRRQFAKLSAAGLAMIAFGGLSGCVGDGKQSPSASSAVGSVSGNPDEVIVTMTPSSEPAAGFDPLFSWGCGEHVHEPLIQSTLITTDAELNFVNDLATSYECSEDGLMWTFKIRDDAFFTDGEPLTARDVAFTINGINANAAAEADLSMVSEAVAVDDKTVELHLSKPYNAMLYTLAVVGIVPEHAYDAATYGADPIGSGRYMLEQWDRGQQVILKANPDYYGEAPLMQRVVVVFMEEDASAAAANAAEVDVAYTSATIVDSMSPSDYSVLDCESVDSRGISLPSVESGLPVVKEGDMAFMVGNVVTADLSLRRAMNLAVDRQAMIESILNGYGSVAYSVSDGMPWYSEYMQVDYDLESAKNELALGGWSEGEDGIMERMGIRASFDLYYPSSDSLRQALAFEFSNQMKQIGVEVNPIGGSWSYDQNGIYVHQYSDPVLWGWGANSPVELYSLHYGSSFGNYADYRSDVVDAHLDAALATPAIEESYPEWQAAQWDGEEGFAPCGASTWIWLCNVNHLYFKRNGLVIAKQKPHPHGHGWSLVNNVDKWYWE